MHHGWERAIGRGQIMFLELVPNPIAHNCNKMFKSNHAWDSGWNVTWCIVYFAGGAVLRFCDIIRIPEGWHCRYDIIIVRRLSLTEMYIINFNQSTLILTFNVHITFPFKCEACSILIISSMQTLRMIFKQCERSLIS